MQGEPEGIGKVRKRCILYRSHFFIHADIHQDGVAEIKESYGKNDLDPFMEYVDKLEDLLAECKESQGKFAEVLSRCQSMQEKMKETCKEKEIANRKKYIALAVGGVAFAAAGVIGVATLGASLLATAQVIITTVNAAVSGGAAAAGTAAASGAAAVGTTAAVGGVSAGSIGATGFFAFHHSERFEIAEQKSKKAGEDLEVLQNNTSKLGEHIAEIKQHLLPARTQASQVTMYVTKHDHEMFCHNFDILLKHIGKARQDLKPLPSYLSTSTQYDYSSHSFKNYYFYYANDIIQYDYILDYMYSVRILPNFYRQYDYFSHSVGTIIFYYVRIFYHI